MLRLYFIALVVTLAAVGAGIAAGPHDGPSDTSSEAVPAASVYKPVVEPPSHLTWPPIWYIDQHFTVKLRGRVDTDAIASEQSPENEAIYGTLDDIVGLRRARIGIEGDWGVDRRYVAEIDLATGNVVPRDIFLGDGDRKNFGEFQLGHFREPFSLEGGTSARYFAFMERSPVNVLDPARNWGLTLFRERINTNSSLAIGVFQAGTGLADLQGGPGSTIDFTGRLTHTLFNEDDGARLLHVGLAFSERIPEDAVIVVNQQPRSSLLEFGDSTTSPFVPKIAIPAQGQQLINAQAAVARDAWWAQAEWYGTIIDQNAGGPVYLNGCHVDCGYFLTGEHRQYESGNGTFGAIHVNRPFLRGRAWRGRPHGWGAWELTARYSYLNFFDRDTPIGPDSQLVGIRLTQPTFGVNWYLSDRVRLMLNYSCAIPDDPNTGTSSANVIGCRLGVFW